MKKIFLFLALGLCLTACSGYLDEKSKSQMTTDYYNTADGLREGVFSLYSSCRELYQDKMDRVNDFSDLIEPASSDNNAYSHVGDPGRGPINDTFKSLHKGIMIANRMEQMIGEPANATEEFYMGEIRALRALFTQYCAEMWGRYGHFQDKVFDGYEEAMLELNQVPLETYYQQILADLDYAIGHLPPQSQISEFGRFSQGAAKALKARTLLAIAGYANAEYSGTPEYNVHSKLGFSSAQAVYTEARTLARSVINDYGYKLCSTYAENWDETKQDNSEVIWSVQWTTDQMYNTKSPFYHRHGVGRNCEFLTLKENADGSHTATVSTLTVTRDGENYAFPCHSMYYGRELRFYMPSFKWINLYSDKDIRKYDNFETLYLRIPAGGEAAAPPDMTDTIAYMPFRIISVEEDQKYIDWVKSGDEHAYYLDGLNEVFDLDDPSDTRHYGGPLRHRSRYYTLKKFYDRSRTRVPKQDDGSKNGVIIRLAEMYLIDAECAFMLGEGEQAVYNALQPIWARCFDNLADADVYKPAPGTMDINFIVDEYERELGHEFNDFFILKRTRTLLPRALKIPISKEEEQQGREAYVNMAEQFGDALYIKPFPLSQARRFKTVTREMMPPGYDYASILN